MDGYGGLRVLETALSDARAAGGEYAFDVSSLAVRTAVIGERSNFLTRANALLDELRSQIPDDLASRIDGMLDVSAG